MEIRRHAGAVFDIGGIETSTFLDEVFSGYQWWLVSV
jgi:hypothetical protein